jgi:hypothetical protein
MWDVFLSSSCGLEVVKMRESHDRKFVGVRPGLQWRVVNEYGWDSADSFSNCFTVRSIFC